MATTVAVNSLRLPVNDIEPIAIISVYLLLQLGSTGFHWVPMGSTGFHWVVGHRALLLVDVSARNITIVRGYPARNWPVAQSNFKWTHSSSNYTAKMFTWTSINWLILIRFFFFFFMTDWLIFSFKSSVSWQKLGVQSNLIRVE